MQTWPFVIPQPYRKRSVVLQELGVAHWEPGQESYLGGDTGWISVSGSTSFILEPGISVKPGSAQPGNKEGSRACLVPCLRMLCIGLGCGSPSAVPIALSTAKLELWGTQPPAFSLPIGRGFCLEVWWSRWGVCTPRCARPNPAFWTWGSTMSFAQFWCLSRIFHGVAQHSGCLTEGLVKPNDFWDQMLNLHQKQNQKQKSVEFNGTCFVDLFVTCSVINYPDLASHLRTKLDMSFAGSHSDLILDCSLVLHVGWNQSFLKMNCSQACAALSVCFSFSHLNKHPNGTWNQTTSNNSEYGPDLKATSSAPKPQLNTPGLQRPKTDEMTKPVFFQLGEWLVFCIRLIRLFFFCNQWKKSWFLVLKT